MYLISVKENGNALKFVDWDKFSKIQIDKICREALKQDKLAIRYIKVGCQYKITK
ncbi:hypothetical protein RHK41_19970 [Clostridioides difficile]|nr:hypothetical protein [Clostridioides difficile]